MTVRPFLEYITWVFFWEGGVCKFILGKLLTKRFFLSIITFISFIQNSRTKKVCCKICLIWFFFNDCEHTALRAQIMLCLKWAGGKEYHSKG